MEKKDKKTNEASGTPSFIVGVGASAGGLEAITAFFENAPDNTAFSYVIIQHLSPDYKSLMSDLLAKHTLMKVVEAEDGELLKPAYIYLLPSKKFMTVKDGRLRLTEKIKSGLPNNAIDVFFYFSGRGIQRKGCRYYFIGYRNRWYKRAGSYKAAWGYSGSAGSCNGCF